MEKLLPAAIFFLCLTVFSCLAVFSAGNLRLGRRISYGLFPWEFPAALRSLNASERAQLHRLAAISFVLSLAFAAWIVSRAA